MNKYVLIIWCAMLFVSCTRSGTATYKAHLVPFKEITLTLDNETPNTSRCAKIYEQGNKELLVYLNDQKPSLLFYDLNTLQLVKNLRLVKEGPQGVSQIKGFFIKNKDSIFVLNPQAYSLSLLNAYGEVTNRYLLIKNTQFISRPDESDVSMPVMGSNEEAYMEGDNLNISAIPDMLPNVKQGYSQGKVNLSVNLKTKDIDYSVGFPLRYVSNNYAFVAFEIYRCLDSRKNLIYSFGACDSIYVYDTHSKFKGAYYAGSKYFDGVKASTGPVSQTKDKELDEKIVTSPFYFYIMYDKYRDVYYRLAAQKHTLNDSEKRTNNLLDKPFSIIILNNKFQIIGEEKFPHSVYSLKNIFVGKEGLYLSRSFYKNTTDDENLLKFSVFKLKN